MVAGDPRPPRPRPRLIRSEACSRT
jgi:hypothetical protein